MAEKHPEKSHQKVYYRTTDIDGLEIFYREAGPEDAPTIVLLHGFPTSSQMFRNLIPQLAGDYHVIAPDFPGFGRSATPDVSEFEYSFDNLARVTYKLIEKLKLKKYSLYVMDYGAPVGYRIASQHPEQIQSLIVQNGNAYEEGLDNDFWKPIKKFWKDKSKENGDAIRWLCDLNATKWQYHTGVRDIEAISPDAWVNDQFGLDRPGNREIQLELFYSYGTNPPHYPSWQQYFRDHQPPMLIVWGKNDQIFPPAGAEPYKKDLKNLEYHLLDTGHFALEEDGQIIADLMLAFLKRVIPKAVSVK
ncbi:MAG: alpha/beta hydrolase [Candidatus Melainabacteria bacterium]|nr:MAG: alpha/beta hydrolase [Candidatus Melainabacteria bacterium]